MRLSLCLYFLPFLFSFPLRLVSQDWLTKFGYLPPPDPVTGQLQTQEELTKAITAMQRFGGLEATGVLRQWLMTPPLLGAERGRDGFLQVRGGEGTCYCVLEQHQQKLQEKLTWVEHTAQFAAVRVITWLRCSVALCFQEPEASNYFNRPTDPWGSRCA